MGPTASVKNAGVPLVFWTRTSRMIKISRIRTGKAVSDILSSVFSKFHLSPGTDYQASLNTFSTNSGMLRKFAWLLQVRL